MVQQNRISQLVVKKLFGNVSGKKITILGFAFKANTNDTRESAAIKICKDLIEEGAILSIHDPKVDEGQITKDLKIESSNISKEGSWSMSDDMYESCKGSDAILVLTEWSEYTKINWQKVSKTLRKPSWIFDSRAIIDKKEVIKAGISLWRLGDGLN